MKFSQGASSPWTAFSNKDDLSSTLTSFTEAGKPNLKCQNLILLSAIASRITVGIPDLPWNIPFHERRPFFQCQCMQLILPMQPGNPALLPSSNRRLRSAAFGGRSASSEYTAIIALQKRFIASIPAAMRYLSSCSAEGMPDVNWRMEEQIFWSGVKPHPPAVPLSVWSKHREQWLLSQFRWKAQLEAWKTSWICGVIGWGLPKKIFVQ